MMVLHPYKAALHPGPNAKRARALAFCMLFILLVAYASILMRSARSEQVPDPLNDCLPAGLPDQGGRALVLAEQDLDYAIITDSRFALAFQPLLEWKAEKGLRTGLFELNGTDGIIFNYYGRDEAEKVHYFLRNLKDKNPGLKWVLLGGDHEIIPSRKLFTGSNTNYSYDDDRNYCYGDVYYSGLDSNWDTNQNGVFGETGEEDFDPDIIIGRLPVSDVEDVDTVVKKVIDYEKSPPDGGWQRSVLLAGALMGAPNIIDDPSTPWDEGYNWYKDNGREVCKAVKDDLPDHIVPFELYDYDEVYGKKYTKMYDQLNRSNFQHYYNLGHSSVLVVGHGEAVDGDFIADYAGMSGGKSHNDFSWGHDALIHYSDAEILGSDGMLPLLYASACSVGNFTEIDDTNFETFVTSPRGAIGLVAATNETWRLEFAQNNTSFGNWWLAREFFYRLYHDDPRPASVLASVKRDYAERWNDPSNPHRDNDRYMNFFRTNRMSYNFLGDPEMMLWTDQRFELNVSYSNPLVIQNQTFEVYVKDVAGGPVPAALCVLGEQDKPDTRTRDYTDNGGKAVIVLSNGLFDSGPLELSVYAHNTLVEKRLVELTSLVDLWFLQTPVISRSFPTVEESVTITVPVGFSGINSPIDVNLTAQVNRSGIENHLYFNRTINGTGTFNVSFSLQAESAPAHVIFELDPEKRILEWNEENNREMLVLRGNIPATIRGLPDIELDEDSSTLDEPSRSISLRDYSSDMDQWPEPLTYWLEYHEPNCSVLIDDELFIQVIPMQDWYGSFNVTVWTFDGAHDDKDTFMVKIIPVNDPPMLPQVGNFTIEQNQPFSLSIRAEDIDDTELTFFSEGELYTLTPDVHDPNRVWINFTPTNDDVGLHFTKITVMDPSGLQASRTIPIEVVNVNDPPRILTSGQFNTRVGHRFILEIEVDDPDPEDRHTFSTDSDIITINSTTGVIDLITNGSHRGKHTILVTVTDSSGANDTALITIDIRSVKDDSQITLAFVIGAGVLILVATYAATVFMGRGAGTRSPAPSREGQVPEYEEHSKEEDSPIQTIKRIGLGQKKVDRDIYLDEDVEDVINTRSGRR